MLALLGQAISTGLVLGAVYALAASGLGIIFGLFGVINFAHTQYMMIAAVVAFMATAAGIPYAIALLLGVLAAALCGVLTERLLIRPLLRHENAQVETLFVTLGLSIVIQNGTLLLWGSQPKYFANSPLQGIIEAGGIVLPVNGLFTILLSIGVFVVLHLLATRTRSGKSVIATAQNPEADRIVGIPVERVRLISFAVGCGLAGLGGILWGTIYSVSYITGGTFLIMSFVLVIMSGPGNITGILICSLLLGMTESLSGAFFNPKWQQLAVMVVFIVVVTRRPQGLGAGRLARRNT
jgi:branched-subunit amino acid ABC-type transport system permease component